MTKRYMIIKVNSDDDFSRYNTLEPRNIIIIIRSAFHESNKYYRQVFSDKCLYKLKIV